jgi:hypothetical protein
MQNTQPTAQPTWLETHRPSGAAARFPPSGGRPAAPAGAPSRPRRVLGADPGQIGQLGLKGGRAATTPGPGRAGWGRRRGAGRGSRRAACAGYGRVCAQIGEPLAEMFDTHVGANDRPFYCVFRAWGGLSGRKCSRRT